MGLILLFAKDTCRPALLVTSNVSRPMVVNIGKDTEGDRYDLI
jgi:hypothetical protein